MTTTVRLLRIELRRGVALWIVPVLGGLVVWGTLATMRPDNSPTLWTRSSIQLALMFVVAALVMCGVGAWAGGRARRRQLVELLATTPSPAVLRDLALLAATVVWGVLLCLAAGALVLVATDREATWGGPALGPIVVGLLSVVAGTVIGYFGGTLSASRFTAPMSAVGLAGLIMFVGTRSSSMAYLSPLTLDPRGFSPYDAFYQATPLPTFAMSLWLVGLTGCAFAGVVLRRRRSLLAVGLLLATLAVAVGAARQVLSADVTPPWEGDYARQGQPVVAYEPACVERSIQICVHPSYAARLDGIADQIGSVVEPLVGVPGGPLRAEQLPEPAGLRPDGTLEVLPTVWVVEVAALDLVRDRDSDPNPAQLAIAQWLARRVNPQGIDIQRFAGQQPDPAVSAAAERFAALSTSAQRAWLEQHFVDLRAGRVALDELP